MKIRMKQTVLWQSLAILLGFLVLSGLGWLWGRQREIHLDATMRAALLEQAVESICRFDILTSGGIMVCESRRGEFAPAVAEPYRVTRRCDYGSVSVTYIVRD